MAKKAVEHISCNRLLATIRREEQDKHMMHAANCGFCGKLLTEAAYAQRLENEVLSQFAETGEAEQLFVFSDKELCTAAALCGYENLWGVKQRISGSKNIAESVKKALRNLEKVRAAEISVSGEARVDAQLQATLKTYCEAKQIMVFKTETASFGRHTFCCVSESDTAVVLAKLERARYALYRLHGTHGIQPCVPQMQITVPKWAYLQAKAEADAFDIPKAMGILAECKLSPQACEILMAIILKNADVCFCNRYDMQTGHLHAIDRKLFAVVQHTAAEIQITQL